jgi:hypothetical protein
MTGARSLSEQRRDLGFDRGGLEAGTFGIKQAPRIATRSVDQLDQRILAHPDFAFDEDARGAASQRNSRTNYVEGAWVAGENWRRESQSARENEAGGRD